MNSNRILHVNMLGAILLEIKSYLIKCVNVHVLVPVNINYVDVCFRLEPERNCTCVSDFRPTYLH